MLDVTAFVAPVVTTAAGLPLGVWQHMHWPGRRDRQLQALIHHNRRTSR